MFDENKLLEEISEIVEKITQKKNQEHISFEGVTAYQDGTYYNLSYAGVDFSSIGMLMDFDYSFLTPWLEQIKVKVADRDKIVEVNGSKYRLIED